MLTLQPQLITGCQLGPTAQARAKPLCLRRRRAGVIHNVRRFGRARRAYRAAIDSRGQDGSKKHPVKARITAQPCDFARGNTTSAVVVAVSFFFQMMQDYGTDQVTVQRLLSVRTYRGMIKAVIFNAATDFLLVGTLLFIGLGLFAYYQAHPEQLVEGLRGDRSCRTMSRTSCRMAYPGC